MLELSRGTSWLLEENSSKERSPSVFHGNCRLGGIRTHSERTRRFWRPLPYQVGFQPKIICLLESGLLSNPRRCRGYFGFNTDAIDKLSRLPVHSAEPVFFRYSRFFKDVAYRKSWAVFGEALLENDSHEVVDV